MSKKEHPFANVVGLMMEINKSIIKYRRGDAVNLSEREIIIMASEFAEQIHDRLEFETKIRATRKD